MNYWWIWRCPKCGNTSKVTFPTSGKARNKGRSHLKYMHDDYETEPTLEKSFIEIKKKIGW